MSVRRIQVSILEYEIIEMYFFTSSYFTTDIQTNKFDRNCTLSDVSLSKSHR